MGQRLHVGGLFVVVAAIVAVFPSGQAWGQFTWTQANVDGFGDVDTTQAFSMAVYDGYLYVGTNNNLDGCEVWRYDGPGPSDWTQVNSDGFGDTFNRDVASMVVYDGRLFASTHNDNGCEVWAYDGSSWVESAGGGFGEGEFMEWGWSLAVHDGKLWAGTGDWQSFNSQVWAWDGGNWTLMNVTGFGFSNNTHIRSLASYNGSLYAGVYNEFEGAELWRYDGPTPNDWTQVGSGGFGDASNGGVRSMTVFQSKLILGTVHWSRLQVITYNGATFDRIDPGTMDKQAARSMTVASTLNRLYVGTGAKDTGAEVWEWTGAHWMQVNTDGFGDADNAAAQSMAFFDDALWVGTGKGDQTQARVWSTASDWIFFDGFESGDTTGWETTVP